MFFFPVLLYILCWKQSLCWLLFLLVFVLILSSNKVSVWRKKILLFYFFSCFCFSHTKHQNPTERNWNQMQLVSLAFLRYKSVLVLNMLKPKFSVWCKNCLQHRPNRTNYTPRLHIIYWCLVWDIVFPGSNLCLLLSFFKKMSTPFVLQLCIAANILM